MFNEVQDTAVAHKDDFLSQVCIATKLITNHCSLHVPFVPHRWQAAWTDESEGVNFQHRSKIGSKRTAKRQRSNRRI